MKVNDISNIVQRNLDATTITPGKIGDTTFQRLLESKLTSQVTAPGTVQQNQAVSPALIDPTIRVESLNLTEQILQQLEDYEGALQNHALSVAELEPFVASLEEKTAALVDFKSQIDPQDPLAKLIDQVSTAAYLESVKYRRGDYNA